MYGVLTNTGVVVSITLEFVEGAGPFRFGPPNLMFTPAQSVSSWASSRTDEPGTWRIGPSIALRNPCIHANENVTLSLTWYEAPSESVFWMIPGAWTLKRVARRGSDSCCRGSRRGR